MTRHRNYISNLIQAFLDFLAVMGAFELSFVLRELSPFRANLQVVPPYIWTTLFVGLTFVTIFFAD